MGSDVIDNLKSKISDLSYVLFVIGKEIDLIIQNSDDENIKDKLRQVLSALQDSNSNVIKLYHEIKVNEAGMRDEWYNDEDKIKSLQQEVDKLSESIDVLLEGNKNFLDSIIAN